MTISHLQAYVDELPAIRAERMLDAAQVAAYPVTMQFSPDIARTWWDHLMQASVGVAASTATAVQKATGFALNGVSVTFDALSSQISRMLGGGVSE